MPFGFRENLDQICWKGLRIQRMSNRLLIEVRKVLSDRQFVVVAGGLANEEAFQAWSYDHWHCEVVKPQLRIYGPTVVLWVDTSLVLVPRYSEVLVMVVFHDFLHPVNLSFWNFITPCFFIWKIRRIDPTLHSRRDFWCRGSLKICEALERLMELIVSRSL